MHIKVNKWIEIISIKAQFDFTYYYNWKITIKRVMQIHNIMVLIFITYAVINHLFFTLLSMSFYLMILKALFKVNNFQHE